MTAAARYTIDCDQLPGFTAAYLRRGGDECAFIETHTAHALPRLLAALAAHELAAEAVRWVIVTHAHLDHAAGAGALMARCPNATLLAHPRAARHLVDPEKLIRGAKAVYGDARFATLYGAIEPIPEARVRGLDDGATFEVGGATLRVHHTYGHANHHLVVEDPALETVYTGDSFGLVYPALQRGVRFALASTSPTGFQADEARRSLDKILALGARSACLTHFDEVRDLEAVATQVRGWIDRSEAWVVGAAEGDEPLAAMAVGIERRLRAVIAEDATGRGLVLSDHDWQLLALDIELNAQGLAFVAERRRRGD